MAWRSTWLVARAVVDAAERPDTSLSQLERLIDMLAKAAHADSQAIRAGHELHEAAREVLEEG
jgi:hypothetical protein